ncbi:MAG: hypothetical protein H6R14_1733 [Proteobacteria bacterium]|nr:hypothetical protein [Pseudomonadota bacterium]
MKVENPGRRQFALKACRGVAVAGLWGAGGSRWAQAATADGDAETLHVLNRLGFGPAPGDLARVRQMGVAAYIDEQLHPERLTLPTALTRRLDSLSLANAGQAELIQRFHALHKAVKDNPEAKADRQRWHRQMTEETSLARLLPALESPRQLQEVMVDFWFNHFNIFNEKGLDRALVASYEREAIRPFVLGRFRDLLGATAHHPAMLFYLDNWLSSAGEGAGTGRRRRGGLNENYARELMELHTLGVDGGYTQQDVTELARMLTGWTFDPRRSQGASTFVFDPRRHDNEDKTWLGHRIAPDGQAEGERALDLLARHPATARHIAFKLAQAFVADAPPGALVDRLARRFTDNDGDIRAVLAALFASAEFRDPAARGAKYKSPYRYVLSSLRTCAVPLENVRPVLHALRELGMPLYGCQTPDGYKNTEAAWLNPEGTRRRITFATALGSGRLPLRLDPDDNPAPSMAPPPAPDAARLLATLGSTLSARTQAVIASADARLQSALLLGSPDFMTY